MICNNCGFQNPANMRFCGNCGTKLAQPGAAGEAHTPRPEAAAERRNVTVLFADLSGYSALSQRMEQDDLYYIIQDYLKTLAESIYKFEGFVDKFMGDGLMALFGAPIALENHAEMAIRAALDMQAALTRLNQSLQARLNVQLAMRVGVHSGDVVAGSLSAGSTLNYTAIGDTVNLASRLEQAAVPGTILASSSVYAQTRPLFEFDSTPPLDLKGFSPTIAYKVFGHKAAPGRLRGLEGLPTPLIGRNDELDLLNHALDDLHTRKVGRVFLLTGDAGIGKSRLTREFIIRARQKGAKILEAASLTYRRSVSFWLYRELIKSLLGISSDATEGDLRNALINAARSVSPDQPQLALPYLESFFDIHISDPAAAARLAEIPAEQLSQRVFLLVRDLILGYARQHSLVIVLEDMHWSDESSISLTSYMADSLRQTPFILVAVARPFRDGPLQEMRIHFERRLGSQLTEIPLSALSYLESENLLDSLISTTDMPANLHAQILQRSAGIPFYIEEFLRVLMDQGAVRRSGENLQWVPGVHLESLGIPESVQGLILSRFDQLSPLPRQVLQTASAIGRLFDVPILARIIPSVEQPILEEIIRSLVEREFIEPSYNPGEYRFKHILVSDAIYNTLLKRERSDLHGRIGKALEERYPDQLDDQVEFLARHYGFSDYHQHALKYLLLAGQKAARAHMVDQASAWYSQAVQILDQTQHTSLEEMQAHSGYGEGLLLRGDYPAALHHFEQAITALGAVDSDQDHQILSRLLRRMAAVHERSGDYDMALLALQRAQETIQQNISPSPIEMASILNDLGWLHFRQGHPDEAESYLGQALEYAEPANADDLVASIFNRLAGVYFQKDDLDTATSYVQRSLDLRERLGDLPAVARTRNNLGLLAWRRGDWPQAIDQMQRSFEITTILGDTEASLELQTNMGLLETDRGSFAKAQEYLHAAQSLSEQIGHTYMQGTACLHLARLRIAEGQWQAAIALSKQAETHFTEIGSQDNEIDILATQAEAYLGLGEVLNAEQALKTAFQKYRDTGTKSLGPSMEHARMLRIQGQIEINQHSDQAYHTLTSAEEEFDKLGNQLEVARTRLLRAQAIAQSQPELSQKLRQESRQVFSSLGAMHDLQLSA